MINPEMKNNNADIANDCFSALSNIPNKIKITVPIDKTMIILLISNGRYVSIIPASKELIPCATDASIRVAVLSK